MNVVSFKGGRAVKKSKLSVPVRYAVQQSFHPAAASSCSDYSPERSGDLDLPDDPRGFQEGVKNKPKVRKIRLKKKLKAYHERKERLAASWLSSREQLVTALLSRRALPLGQKCVLPSCEEDAIGRCLHCSPGQYLCEGHINIVHAGGKSLHQPEVWKVCSCFHL